MYDVSTIVQGLVGILIAGAIYFTKKYLQNIETSVSHIPDLTLRVSEISLKMDLKHSDHDSKLREHDLKIAHLESLSVRTKRIVP